MARIVLINDGSLEPIKRLIIKLCETSGIKDDKIRIRDIAECGANLSSHIIVLNKINPSINLTKAMSTLATSGALLLNADEKNIAGIKVYKPVKLITYGLDPKSSVTASSIDMDGRISVQCCIQRSFANLFGNILEPQEFSVSSRDISLNVYDVLAAVSVSLLCGADIKQFSHEDAKLTVQ